MWRAKGRQQVGIMGKADGSLPLPFLDRPWKGEARRSAEALWAWHLALAEGVSGAREAGWMERAEARVQSRQTVPGLPDAVCHDAYEAVARHNLPVDLLAEQLRGAQRMAGPLTFASSADLVAFSSEWAAPHGRLLAGLAAATYSWQLSAIDSLSLGFLLISRLVNLQEDLKKERVFIPLSDLEAAGVNVETLARGPANAAVKRLIWKQVIRARDSLASGLSLTADVAPPVGRAIRYYWFGGLEVLHEIERRGFDLWSRPLSISAFQRMQVTIQARFSRATGKAH